MGHMYNAIGNSNSQSYFAHLESAEFQFRRIEREAKVSWTPGEVLGELLTYLDRLESFTESDISASWAQKRICWLTTTLNESVQRSLVVGLDPEKLRGIFSALRRHDALLSSERTLMAPSVKSARDLIRLEVAFLIADSQRS
jgi:hypothetical protein